MIYLALLLAGSAAPAGPEVEPRGNPADWIRFQDLPADALREKKADVVVFRVAVNAAGAPVNCSIQQSSGSRRIDGIVCDQLMRNGRFQPAKNAEGLAISGQWTSRTRLGNAMPSTPANQVGLSYDAEFEYRVDRDGKAIGCRSIRAVDIPPVNCSDALGKRVITPPSGGKFNGGILTIHTTRSFTPN
jgi:TonB family protein